MSITIDKLVRSRRKTIALVVEKDGSLTVRAPMQMSQIRIRQFVDAHKEWIFKHQSTTRLQDLPAPKQYQAGEPFFYLGEKQPLHLERNQDIPLRFDRSGFHLAQSFHPHAEQIFIRWYQKQARQIIQKRVREMALQHEFTYTKIRISSARTRWGSCSSKGTLSFTWRLVMAPQEVIDYVIIHELVHIRIRNHSRLFWAHVAELLPDYKNRKRWLKQNGKYLTL